MTTANSRSTWMSQKAITTRCWAMSYVQIAREGLGHQKSQTGGGMIPKAGALGSTYHRFGSVVPAQDKETSFFDGIDVHRAASPRLAPRTARRIFCCPG